MAETQANEHMLQNHCFGSNIIYYKGFMLPSVLLRTPIQQQAIISL